MGVDIILKIAGIGIFTAIVSVILKKSDRDDVATFATLAGLIVVIVLVLDMISGLFDTIKNLLSIKPSCVLHRTSELVDEVPPRCSYERSAIFPELMTRQRPSRYRDVRFRPYGKQKEANGCAICNWMPLRVAGA